MATKRTKPGRDKRLCRLQVMLTRDELEALDEFRFAKRMPTRAATIREILRRGLRADGFRLADGDSRSRQFGVLSDESHSASADD
jgi:hypothetical protein